MSKNGPCLLFCYTLVWMFENNLVRGWRWVGFVVYFCYVHSVHHRSYISLVMPCLLGGSGVYVCGGGVIYQKTSLNSCSTHSFRASLPTVSSIEDSLFFPHRLDKILRCDELLDKSFLIEFCTFFFFILYLEDGCSSQSFFFPHSIPVSTNDGINHRETDEE